MSAVAALSILGLLLGFLLLVDLRTPQGSSRPAAVSIVIPARAAYEQLSAYANLVAMMASGALAPGRRHGSPVAFGPCLVTSADAYRQVGGHEVVADEIIEDIHLPRAYGAAGREVHALAGGTAASFRVIWNDALGVALMVAYGVVVILPLIAIQRYDRGRTDRILTARSRRTVVATRA